MAMKADSYAVTYAVDEATFMRSCHALWAYRAIGRWGNFAIAGAIIACAILLIWKGVPGPVAPLLVAGGLVIVAMDLLRDWLWRRQFRRAIALQGVQSVKITAQGVASRPDDDAIFRPWRSFQCFARTDEFLFIIIDQRHFLSIPLAAFSDAQAAAGCEAMLVAHLRRLPRRFF